MNALGDGVPGVTNPFIAWQYEINEKKLDMKKSINYYFANFVKMPVVCSSGAFRHSIGSGRIPVMR